MCTQSSGDRPHDTLDDALNEIAGLASQMNEEKRDADSRLRLFRWQQRITGRGPSPLVQPHRKLIMDGALNLIRLVKKASSFVETDAISVVDAEQTITPAKVVVPVEYIAPEPMDRPIMLILCTDLLVLAQQRGEGWDGQVDLFNVLRMATLREPASIVHGNVLRVVDNKVGLQRNVAKADPMTSPSTTSTVAPTRQARNGAAPSIRPDDDDTSGTFNLHFMIIINLLTSRKNAGVGATCNRVYSAIQGHDLMHL